jgi:DNA-binding winged helix-turn-helix (wHTH) protein/predicted Zn-dependent protease/TolB-like protein
MEQGQSPVSSPGLQDFYEFGIYRIDVGNRSLYRAGEFVPLSPKVFDTLLVLIQEAGRVVTKDELMQKVWPDAFVEEGNIANNISTLRKLLNPDFDGEGPIATVPKRGYRFTAEIRLRNASGEIAVHAPAAVSVSSEPAFDESPSVTHKVRRLKVWYLVAAGIPTLLITAFAIYFVSSRSHAISEKDTLVITDFTNKTGDAVFDDTLKQALIFDLEQSPRLNIISDRKVVATLRMMGRTADEHVAGETARELCQRVGSKAMLTGTISALESEYLIGLQAIDCNTGDAIIAEQARASGRGNVLNALDEAAARLRERLGESLASIQKFSTPLYEVTTPSLEALKAYSIGRKMTTGVGDLPALPYLQRAVELDPNFAVAYSGLAFSYENVGESTRSLQAAKKAYELRDHVSEYERLRITGSYHLNVTGQLDEAIRAFDMWARDYPHDAPPFNNQGFAHLMLGQLDEALQKTTTAGHLEPTSSPLAGNLAQIQLAVNQFDEARKTATAALQYNPDLFSIRLAIFQEAFLRGDTAAMQEQLAWAENHPGDGDWVINSKGDSEAYYGRLKSATSYFDRAISSAKKLDNSEMAATWQAKVALIEAEFGNLSEARRYAAAALATKRGRDVRAYVALALARVGDEAQAKKLTEELSKEFPQNTLLQKYWLPTTKAAIELHAGKPTEALRTLEEVEPMDLSLSYPLDYGTMYSAHLRGLVYLKLSKGKEAAAEFKKIVDHRGLVINFAPASMANLELARAYELSGEKEKSRTAYNDFLALWKNADADIPVLQQVKSEFSPAKGNTRPE